MKNKLILIALFVFSATYLFPIIKMNLGEYDEGVILAGADRIIKGHVPYTDFWALYPPGQFYTLAILFDTFGSSLLVARIYDIATKALIPILGFLIARKLQFSTKIALVTWGMLLVWVDYSGSTLYPVYPSILLILTG
ncbi:MAG: hypothetical protein V3S55_00460, partial [Nitrospiraceae bacterium]